MDKLNNKKIKPFKGRRIRMKYNSKNSINDVSGVITASTTNVILFRINISSEHEIPIKYQNIIEINELEKIEK